MLKEAAGVAGAAIIFSPLGFPIIAHGLAGMIVGNAGLFVVDAFLKEIRVAVGNAVAENREPCGVDDAEHE
jgi:hypothetical protein